MRLALYAAPPADHPLAEKTALWLSNPPPLAGFSAETLHALTADPRHYGFHATLKAPFALAAGATTDLVIDAARRFALHRAAPPPLSLKVRALGPFLALVPPTPVPAIDALAAGCLRSFEPFRAPSDPADLARRRAAGLTPSQDAHLARWGYPYVLGDYRFHMTLSGPLIDANRREALSRALADWLAPALAIPVSFRDLCVFGQDDRATPFTLIARLPFEG
ncbi:hypothetical protein CKO38_16915 [Rhodospirillum rubrum]|uniref:DUF1045 domain-containing protein n=1 Tax=Rhodospirillum rubrum TaxID=1085 RepID=UPI0019055D51|nr:DUF1045 domain-containing protein [Rhodospirillum rubrum]MBK1665354.1 hypothetical protein [Rhodospirillum rubrum]MBK1678321.1 hypothetical protein [Rhodospirillum rubrum]